MRALVSIIVPIYKVEPYLKRCVESLRKQSYENIEIILVDDGSPDSCPVICDEYAKQDSRIRVIHQENGGLSAARNAGIEAARGEYLSFVDSDDYVAEDFIESLYELLQESGAVIAQCRFAYVHGEELSSEKNRNWTIYRGESLMEQLYAKEEWATYFVVAWNKLYRREVFQEIRYPVGRIHEDEATTYQLFHIGKRLAFLDRALYGYFVENTGSITATFSRKRFDYLTAQEERIAFFQKSGYERLLSRAYKKLCDACITFYFRCDEQVEDAQHLQKELQKRLRLYEKRGKREIAKLPMRTRLGYLIFFIDPSLYQYLLQKQEKK